MQAFHQRRVVVGVVDLKARIEALFLADGADRVAFVIVRGKDQRLFREPHQALQAFVLGAGVAVLEIGAAGAADEQRVAGEHAIAEMEAVGIVGVAGRVEHVEAQALDAELVAVARSACDTTSTLLCSPMTVMQWVRSRNAPKPVMWSACRCVSTAFTSLRSSSSISLR